MREETVNRIGSMFFGLLLFFFGLPFTLVPLMMLSWGEIDPDYPFESLDDNFLNTILDGRACRQFSRPEYDKWGIKRNYGYYTNS